MDWTRGRAIGHGSTATVSVATDNRSGRVSAVKSAELSNSESLKREQRILSMLRSPHIICYNGFNISSENGKLFYNIFMEYARGGTLTDEIRRRGGMLKDAIVTSYARQMLLGLEYLHSNGIVHCDIKSQNILVTGDGLKISDLGCAKRMGGVSNSDWIISGTPAYMAPEVARGEEQGFPADIWAFGCTVIEMATGRPPCADISDPVSALYRIGFSSDVPDIPKFLSKEAQEFLEKCLKRNPDERWTAGELLAHEFVKEKEFDFLFREDNNHNSETPTSVLNPVQGYWSSMESPTHVSSSSGSASERIRKLSGGNSDPMEMVNWDSGEDWITVRINEDGNCGGEEMIWVSDEEFRWNILDDHTVISNSSEINTCHNRSDGRRGNFCDQSLVVLCKCRSINDDNLTLSNKKCSIPNSLTQNIKFHNSILSALILRII